MPVGYVEQEPEQKVGGFLGGGAGERGQRQGAVS